MITIKIKTDNAAFEGDDLGREVGRILHRYADYVESLSGDVAEDRMVQVLFEINGNAVGKATFK